MNNVNVIFKVAAMLSVSVHLAQGIPISNIAPTTPALDGQDEDAVVVEVASNNLLSQDTVALDLSVFGISLYGLPDYLTTGRLLSDFRADTAMGNPEELGTYVEGDILVPLTSITLNNGLPYKTSRWPGATIPYEMRGNFSQDELAFIADAMNQFHVETCIRFVLRSTESDYITITGSPTGCWTAIGRLGGEQPLNLQANACFSKLGTVVHELMHAVGFSHEQNREDRDAYVAIRYENIKKKAYGNFRKLSPTATFGVPYDYGSVMHYSTRAFSKNGQPTIEAMKPEGNQLMGQRNGLSPLDVEKINRMYNCYEEGV